MCIFPDFASPVTAGYPSIDLLGSDSAMNALDLLAAQWLVRIVTRAPEEWIGLPYENSIRKMSSSVDMSSYSGMHGP